MKKFLIRALLFSAPVILGFVLPELYIRFSENTFNAKVGYIKKHAAEVELLILGTSHNQNGINPDLLSMSAINAAYGSQDITLDSALFFHFIPQMDKLKAVIMEMDYHTLEEKNAPDYFRFPWYYHFYGIECGKFSWLEHVSMYATEPEFFNDYILRQFDPREYKYQLSEQGFILNDFPGPFEDAKFDSLHLAETAVKRVGHNNLSPEIAVQNARTMNSILDYCNSHNLPVILISAPMFSGYIALEKSEKLERKNAYLKTILERRNVFYLDHEEDADFRVTDFKNDDHLNSRGAEKLTKKINQEIDAIMDSLARTN